MAARSNRSRMRALVVFAVLLEAGFAGLYALGDLEEHVVEFIAVYLLFSPFYLASCYLITRPNENKSARRGLWGLIWAAAIVFRLTLLPIDANLSEDLYRYRWQGMLQAAGGNPYSEVPEDPRWAGLRDSTWERVTRKDLPSVYGPLYELIYRGWHRAAAAFIEDESAQAWSFKLPFAAFELAAAWVLGRLLLLLGRPREWLLIWLWSPLVVVEFWGQGHNDSLVVCLVVGALALARRKRWPAAFAALSLATAAKFWPVVLFPFFLLERVEGRWELRWKAALVAVPIAVAVSWPYFGALSNVVDGLEGFAGGWRNNDSLYGYIYEWAERDFERGAQLVVRILAASLALLWLARPGLIRAAQGAVMLILFLSANCFPWYLSWLIPFLAIRPNAALLMWTCLVGLAYHVLIGYSTTGVWEYSDEFRRLEYLPVFALLAASPLVSRAWARMNPHFSPADGESER